MVYDPIRDCEVASPATSFPRSGGSALGPPYATPESDDPRLAANGRHLPPSFSSHPHTDHPYAPSSYPTARSASGGGGLRGLLNDDAQTGSRRSSSISSSHLDEPRPSIHRLLNESSAPPSSSSQPLSKSSSGQSSSPSNPSPGPGSSSRNREFLDPNGFLTPSQRSTSRSPHPLSTAADHMSPSAGYAHLPPQGHASMEGHYHSQHYYETPQIQSGPSRRRPSVGIPSGNRPMLPPQDIPAQPGHPAYGYDPHGRGGNLPLRSPSVSLSPRSQHAPLPSSTSRPGSATSQSHPFFFQAPPPPAFSPSAASHRRLSEDPATYTSRPPSSSASSHRARKPSVPPLHLASLSPRPTRSPSPLVSSTPYAPARRNPPPRSLLRPIAPDELAALRAQALSNNPLRRKARANSRKPLPSWSGPSPSGRQAYPSEDGASYFPPHFQQQGSMSRPGSSGQGVLRSSAQDDRMATPTGANGRNGSVQGGGAARHLKRPSSPESSGGAADTGRDSTRRKVSGAHFVGNSAVAQHYNQRQEVGLENRELSPIIGLKKFNNWIKSVLIGKFAYRPPRGGPAAGRMGAKVLDIGCGKGGDLNKWKQARISLYVGLDIAAVSVEQARERYNKLGRAQFEAHFFAHDCYTTSLQEVLPEHLAQVNLYDNVTMQFCMHYAFESASKARMMIENVARYLRPGGVFIGTIPDADLLLARLNELPEDELRFGNSCYFVEFAERRHKGLYGHAYRFFLQDAVEDVPEYLVNWDNFVALAEEYRLRLIYKKSFNDVLQEEQASRDFGPLLGKMGVVNDRGESAMDESQWEAANLYMGFAFERM